MVKKSSYTFTTEQLKAKGFTEDRNGNWLPPKGKTIVKLGGGQEVVVNDIVEKKPVIESIDFKNIPTTEWFISNYNVPSKKNNRQNFVKNGKQISIPSKAHSDYVKATDMQYKVFANEFKRAITHFKLKNPLRVEFTFVRSSKRRFDYSNAVQTVEDLMVANEWLEDDSADHIIPSFNPYEYDKNRPGVKIKLLIK